ncbi:MAG: alpha/beta hydrolase [Chitinophagaceae bacterium]
MKKTIYCISGLGADEKIFRNLSMNGIQLEYISWLKPLEGERIGEYAGRMASPILHSKPVLLGVSFGGMIGIEIAKQIKLEKLIIVSSIKSADELPRWMRVAGKMKLNKFLPTRSYRLTNKIDSNRIGVATEEEKEMVKAYRKVADPYHLQWSINEVLNWKNDWQPENMIHIHGDKDKIFPIKNTAPTHIVKEGTHMIIYNRAGEISKFIEEAI